jgi:ligand-binding SRPBCC domain-containing protein
MAFFQLNKKLVIQASLDEVWEFISNPHNLKQITPEYMGFDITTKNLPGKIYPGMIIGYKVRPLLGITMNWVTEITHMEEKKFFVDEQRIGPYTMWHHQHHIEPVRQGVLMRDIVSYRPPLGFLGNIANSLVIRRQLEDIFEFRKTTLEALFNTIPIDLADTNQ